MEEKIIEKAVRLFRYLGLLTYSKNPKIGHVDQNRDVLFLEGLPQNDLCQSHLWQSSFPLLLKIKRPTFSIPPLIPLPLKEWIKQEDLKDSSTRPNLLKKIPSLEHSPLNEEKDSIPPFIYLTDNPHIKEEGEKFLSETWGPWADQDKELKKVENLYQKLRFFLDTQHQLEEAFEIVFAVGLLNDQENGEIMRHHLLTKGVHLETNTDNQTLNVLFNNERPSIEQDILDRDQWPPKESLLKIKDDFLTKKEIFTDRETLQKIFELWEQKKKGISLAPALILRKKTQKSFFKFISKICDNLQETSFVPEGVRQFVDFTKQKEKPFEKDDKIIPYFPLISNEEQRSILKGPNDKKDILIQGPPGTGKSHTVLNLTAHFLAMGKKVLVTSELSRPLFPLQKKCPKEIQDLFLSYLGPKKKLLNSLENSIQNILTLEQNFDLEHHQRSINFLEEDLKKNREQTKKLYGKLQLMREDENVIHNNKFGTYKGTLPQIIKQLLQEQPLYEWFKDTIGPETPFPFLKKEDPLHIYNFYKNCDLETEKNLTLDFLPLPLFSLEDFKDYVIKEKNIEEKIKTNLPFKENDLFYDLKSYSSDLLKKTTRDLREMRALIKETYGENESWVTTALNDILGQNGTQWEHLKHFNEKTLQFLKSFDFKVFLIDVEGIDSLNLNLAFKQTEDLLKHLQKKKGLGRWPLRAKEVKEAKAIIKNVTIEGERCDHLKSVEKLLQFLSIRKSIQEIVSLWKAAGIDKDLPPLQLINALESSEKILNKCFEIKEKFLCIESKIPLFKNKNWSRQEILEKVQKNIELVIYDKMLSLIKIKLKRPQEEIERKTTSKTHPFFLELVKAIKERNPHHFEKILQMIFILQQEKKKFREIEELSKEIKTTCPLLYSDLKERIFEKATPQHLEDFTKAFTWKKTLTWVKETVKSSSPLILLNLIQGLKKEELHIVGELTRLKSWTHFFNKLDNLTKELLFSWIKSLKKTGLRGPHLGPQILDLIQSILPAWIVPLSKVTEMITPEAEIFDVAIVDEASQLGPEAMILFYLAKKVIVVGDDKQMVPTKVINREEIQQLQQRISDIPHFQHFGINDNFYDLCEIKLHEKVKLKEHFRSRPEIIQFSNQLSYGNTPLLPLKQFSPPKIKETLETVYCPKASLEGKKPDQWNPQEVEAILNKLKEAFSNPLYQEMTFGIISLSHSLQTKKIKEKILSEIPKETIQKRQVICGPPPIFQGLERDVILLSLVLTEQEDQKFDPINQESDQRNFNLAVSRAKEKVILFHSIELKDLNPFCLSAKLLKYFQTPHKWPLGLPPELDTETLKTLVKDSKCVWSSPPRPFEKWFEVILFLKIKEKGYLVIPKFETVGKKMDFMITGDKNSLVIDCFGKLSSTPLMTQASDEQNQENGWPHYYIMRESLFTLDSEGCLQSLWNKLNSLGIYPRLPSPPKEEGLSKEALAPCPQEMLEEAQKESKDAQIKDCVKQNKVLHEEDLYWDQLMLDLC